MNSFWKALFEYLDEHKDNCKTLQLKSNLDIDMIKIAKFLFEYEKKTKRVRKNIEREILYK